MGQKCSRFRERIFWTEVQGSKCSGLGLGDQDSGFAVQGLQIAPVRLK